MIGPSPRIKKQTTILLTDPPQGINVETDPDPNNFRHLIVHITGPQGSVYEGGRFVMDLYMPQQYPMKPPAFIFRTKIYHPNIDNKGNILLTCLTPNFWSPALNLKSQISNVLKRLYSPLKYIDEALNDEVLIVWKTNQPFAEQKAKEYTNLFAK